MNPRVQALLDRVRAIDLTPRQRRILTWTGYPLFALLVALITFYSSVPRERVKDKLEMALSADVSSGQPLAIGMDVQIGELSTTLFTGVGFKAQDIVLRTRPIAQGEKPARYIIDDVRVRLGLFSTMFGRPAYSFTAHALSGTVKGKVSGNNDGTKAKVELDSLVLNGVAGIQQALGGLPVEGTISGKLDAEAPKNLLANANGTVDIDVDGLAIGDGKAKLTVPGDPFLSAGVTIPRVRLGKLSGQIVIEKGKARFDNVRVHSADADATLEGYVELHDPIAMSQIHAYLKFRPSEALVKREPTLELLNSTMTTAKRSDGFIGIQMTGPLSAIFFMPSKDPPFGVTSRSEPAPTAAPPAPPPPRPSLAPAPGFVPPPNTAPPAAANEPAAPPSPAPIAPATGSPTPTPPAPAPSGATGSGATGAPAPGGGEIASPPPTTGSGTTVAPPPSVRTMRAAEAVPAEPPPPPAKEHEAQ
jgi:type II secretion system protein N